MLKRFSTGEKLVQSKSVPKIAAFWKAHPSPERRFITYFSNKSVQGFGL